MSKAVDDPQALLAEANLIAAEHEQQNAHLRGHHIRVTRAVVYEGDGAEILRILALSKPPGTHTCRGRLGVITLTIAQGAAQVVDGEVVLEAASNTLLTPSGYTWRSAQPTLEEVQAHAWWWNKPSDGAPPHVLHLGVEDGDIVDVNDGGTPIPLFPGDWPGEWAPALPPKHCGRYP